MSSGFTMRFMELHEQRARLEDTMNLYRRLIEVAEAHKHNDSAKELIIEFDRNLAAAERAFEVVSDEISEEFHRQVDNEGEYYESS